MRWLKSRYHWVIVAVVLLEMMVFGGVLNNLSGLFVVPVTQSLGITRTAFAAANCMRGVGAILSSLFAMVVIKRIGYRKSVTACLMICALGMAAMATTSGVFGLYIGYLTTGICESFCLTVGATQLISRWFHRHRGTILGLVSSATGFGGSLFTILLSQVMLQADWRWSYGVCCISLMAVSIILLVTVRDRPEIIGLAPLGFGQIPAKKKKAPEDYWYGYSIGKIRRMSCFYILIITTFISCMCSSLGIPMIIPYLQEAGIDSTQAAGAYSVMLLVLSGAKFLCGVISDRLGARWANSICVVACGIGAAMFLWVTGVAQAYAAAIVYALGLPITTITISVLVPNLFGYNSSSAILGPCYAVAAVAYLIGTFCSNWIYDLTGSYKMVLWLIIACAAVSMVLYLLVYKMADKVRRMYLADEAREGQMSAAQG